MRRQNSANTTVSPPPTHPPTPTGVRCGARCFLLLCVLGCCVFLNTAVHVPTVLTAPPMRTDKTLGKLYESAKIERMPARSAAAAHGSSLYGPEIVTMRSAPAGSPFWQSMSQYYDDKSTAYDQASPLANCCSQ